MNNMLFTWILFALAGWSIYATFSFIYYRSLTVKLTGCIKNMYCTEKGCDNLKYYSTPIDGKKGVMTEYCSIHLMEHVGNEDN